MSKFNSSDHYINYWGQEFLRGNGITLTVNKSPKCSTWVQPQKRQNGLSLFPRQTIQCYSNPSLCPNHKCQRSWSCPVLWIPMTPSRINTSNRCPFHNRGLECKSWKWRDTQNNRQVWHWSTKWSREKSDRVLSRKHAMNAFSNNPRDSTHGHQYRISQFWN